MLPIEADIVKLLRNGLSSTFEINDKKENSCTVISNLLPELKATVTKIPLIFTEATKANIHVVFHEGAIQTVQQNLFLHSDQNETITRLLTSNIINIIQEKSIQKHSADSSVDKEPKLRRINPTPAIAVSEITLTSSTKKEIAAATKIQSYCRAFLKGREFPYLAGRRYVDTGCTDVRLYRMLNGNTPVYSSDGLKVVLKKSGAASASRLTQMEYARQLCKEKPYTHLVVPTGEVYKNYIIESKFDVNTCKEYQICLYMKHSAKFDEAVKEFVGFIIDTDLSDLTERDATYRCMFDKGQYPITGRYDNVPLYIDKEEGFIGLIDLEHIKDKGRPDQTNDYLTAACSDAITLFPLHYQMIIDKVKELYPEFVPPLVKLQEIRDQTISFFEKICGNHKVYIERHKITDLTPYKINRALSIDRSIESQLAACYEKFTDGTKFPESFISESLKNLPEIIELIEVKLNDHMKSKISNSTDLDIDLLMKRRIQIPHYSKFTSDLAHLLKNRVSAVDPLTVLPIQYFETFVNSVLLPAIFTELKARDQISFYTNSLSGGSTIAHLIYF